MKAIGLHPMESAVKNAGSSIWRLPKSKKLEKKTSNIQGSMDKMENYQIGPKKTFT